MGELLWCITEMLFVPMGVYAPSMLGPLATWCRMFNDVGEKPNKKGKRKMMLRCACARWFCVVAVCDLHTA